MCFHKSKESKVLIAKRDITVYKLGCRAGLYKFYPIYQSGYCYYEGKIAMEDVLFNNDIIYQAFHSYISCKICPSDTNSFAYVKLYYINNADRYVTCYHYSKIFLGKFIIPKGTTYCMNAENEVVSNSIVYTGIYTQLNDDAIINTKDLWKDK